MEELRTPTEAVREADEISINHQAQLEWEDSCSVCFAYRRDKSGGEVAAELSDLKNDRSLAVRGLKSKARRLRGSRDETNFLRADRPKPMWAAATEQLASMAATVVRLYHGHCVIEVCP